MALSEGQAQLISLTLAVVLVGFGLFGLKKLEDKDARTHCSFSRNEPAQQGWWWDIYKCGDGTERRLLVASPKG